MTKYLLIPISFLLIYFKPLYGFLLIPFFYLEFFFFLEYFFIFYKNKKHNKYFILKIDNFDNTTKSILKIWININRINGFIKLYSLFSKKNVNFLNIIKIIIIYFFNIPLKLILLLKKIIYNNGCNFNEKILFVYASLHETSNSLKIEVLRNVVYLNCFTLKKFLTTIKNISPSISKEECFALLQMLKMHNAGYSDFENKEIERISFYLAHVQTCEGYNIPFIHPTYIWNLKMNRFNYSNNIFSIHATSNIEIEVTTTQIKGSPISELIKKNAKEPGCIFTKNPTITRFSDFKSVKKISVEALLIDKKNDISEVFGWELDLKYQNYLTQKEQDYFRIINSTINIQTGNDLLLKSLVSQLMCNNWENVFLNSNEFDFLQEIDDVIKK